MSSPKILPHNCEVIVLFQTIILENIYVLFQTFHQLERLHVKEKDT